MKYFSVALITVAAFVGDFLASWAELPDKQINGWSYTSTACLLYAAWFFWRGRPGGPSEDEGRIEEREQREPEPKRQSAFDRALDESMAKWVRRTCDPPPGKPGAAGQPDH